MRPGLWAMRSTNSAQVSSGAPSTLTSRSPGSNCARAASEPGVTVPTVSGTTTWVPVV